MVCYGSFAPTFPAPSFTEAGKHSAQAPASERSTGAARPSQNGWLSRFV